MEVEALDMIVVVLSPFVPLPHEPITISKLIVGLIALDTRELELETFGLYTWVKLVVFYLPSLGVEVLGGVVLFLGGGVTLGALLKVGCSLILKL